MHFQIIEQRTTLVTAAAQLDLGKRAVFLDQNAAVIEQLIVRNLVHRTVTHNEVQMGAQTLGMTERGLETVQKVLFFLGQCIGVLGVYGREIGVGQRIFLAADLDGALLQIHLVEQQTAFHLILGMTADELAFQLEHHHRDRLVHLGCQRGIDRVELVFVQYVRHEALARVVRVGGCREHGQRTQVNAVPVLQAVKTVVADGDTQHAHEAHRVAAHRTNPGNVVIAPLDVNVVVLHQLVQNTVGTRTAVKNITDNM